MATVELHVDARDWLQQQPQDVQNQITDRLRRAAKNPDHYLDSLTNTDLKKLRIGEYRAKIDWDKQGDRLRVVDLGKRDKFYG